MFGGAAPARLRGRTNEFLRVKHVQLIYYDLYIYIYLSSYLSLSVSVCLSIYLPIYIHS